MSRTFFKKFPHAVPSESETLCYAALGGALLINENEARELYERERDAAAGSMPTVTNKEEKKTWAWNELQDPS